MRFFCCLPSHVTCLATVAPPSALVSLDSVVAIGLPLRGSLLSCASHSDGALLGRLAANTVAACSHATATTTALTDAVRQCVPGLVLAARRRLRGVDKLLGMKAEECEDSKKSLQALLQLTLACQDTAKVLEGSMYTIIQLLEGASPFTGISTLLATAGGDLALHRLAEASHIDIGIDPARCKASHALWLSRGERNVVIVALADEDGEPVYGILPVDVLCTFASEAVGASVMSVSVEASALTIEVLLPADAPSTVLLRVLVYNTSIPVPLQVCMRTAWT